MKYFVRENYCCGEGTWLTVANGVVVESGMDVLDETGKVVFTCCGSLGPLPGPNGLNGWLEVEIPSKDGRYRLNEETDTIEEIER